MKTCTIEGKKYTAKRLLKLAAENGVETNGNDTITTLPTGGDVCITKYSDGSIGVRNYGCIHRKKSFGDLISQLD
jgi:hypothetical protein